MRSKPDPVDQPERIAHYDGEMCIAEMLHNTIATWYEASVGFKSELSVCCCTDFE